MFILCTQAQATDEEVVVTAARTPELLGDAPVAVEVITREDIENSGAMDVATIIEALPGVQLERGFAGTTLSMLGLNTDHVLILINGQRIAGRKDSAVDLSRIPLDNVERIEIVKGAASALYGSDAMGGVVNIVLREAAHPVEASLKAQAGHLVSTDGVGRLALSKGKTQGAITAGSHTNRVYDLEPNDVGTSGDARAQWDVATDGSTRPSDTHRLGWNASYARTRSQGTDSPATGAVLNRTNLYEDARAALSWDTQGEKAGGSITLSASTYRDQYLVDQEGGSALDSYEETRESLGEIGILGHAATAKHHATVGVDLLGESIVSPRLEPNEVLRWRVAPYLQDVWNPVEPLDLVVGARADFDGQFGAFLSPKASMRWDVSDAVVARAGVGTGYRAPDFRELSLVFSNPTAGYRVEGNEGLRPERSVQGTASVDSTPSNRITLGIAGHWSELYDLIDFGVVSSGGGATLYQYNNVARARTRGGDATVGIGFPGALDAKLTYTFLDARDLTLDRPLPGRSAHQATLVATGTLPNGTSSLTVRNNVRGPRPYYPNPDDPLERQEVGVTAQLDLRASQRIGRSVTVAALANNLLDAGDAEYFAVPPREFFAELSLELPHKQLQENP